MQENPLAFVGSVPEHYDRLLGPFLFEPYAVHAAEIVLGSRPARILEVASGTGRVTRHLIDGLDAGALLSVTDLSSDMLAIAQARLGASDNVRWEVADAANLVYGDANFDAVVCQFGLMFLPDRLAGLCEWHRVLCPGGRLTYAVWDSLDANPAWVIRDVLGEMFADGAPQFMQLPHSMHDADELGSITRRAGFADVVVDRVALTGRSPSARDVASGFVYGTPLLASLTSFAADRIEELCERLTGALITQFGDKPLSAPLSAYVVTASKGVANDQ